MSFTMQQSAVSSLCSTFRGTSLSSKKQTIAKASSTTTETAKRTAHSMEISAVVRINFDGSSAGEANLDLKTAKAEVAKGIVHKYVIMVRQNARRVSIRIILLICFSRFRRRFLHLFFHHRNHSQLEVLWDFDDKKQGSRRNQSCFVLLPALNSYLHIYIYIYKITNQTGHCIYFDEKRSQRWG